jgi:hypothetical protein
MVEAFGMGFELGFENGFMDGFVSGVELACGKDPMENANSLNSNIPEMSIEEDSPMSRARKGVIPNSSNLNEQIQAIRQLRQQMIANDEEATEEFLDKLSKMTPE